MISNILGAKRSLFAVSSIALIVCGLVISCSRPRTHYHFENDYVLISHNHKEGGIAKGDVINSFGDAITPPYVNEVGYKNGIIYGHLSINGGQSYFLINTSNDYTNSYSSLSELSKELNSYGISEPSLKSLKVFMK